MVMNINETLDSSLTAGYSFYNERYKQVVINF